MDAKKKLFYNLKGEKMLVTLEGYNDLGSFKKKLKRKAKKAVKTSVNIKKQAKIAKGSTQKAIKAAKTIRTIAKPLTTIGNKVMNNPVVIAACASNPYTAAGMAAYQGYRKIKDAYSDMKNVKDDIDSAKNTINSNASLKEKIIQAAALKAGVALPEGGLTQENISAMRPNARIKLAVNLQNTQTEVLAQNYAGGVVKDIAKQAIENDEANTQTFTESEKSTNEKWTPEQIAQFNAMQSQGSVLDIESQIKEMNESAGDQYYKKGLLQGDITSLVNELSNLIFTHPKYASMQYDSEQYVNKIITSYVKSVNILNEKTGKVWYYNGTTETERKQFYGNIFIKITYLLFKGYTDESEYNKSNEKLDYKLRDEIWTILAQVKENALKDSRFIPVWRVQGSVDSESPLKMLNNKNMLIAAGVGALLLLMRKK